MEESNTLEGFLLKNGLGNYLRNFEDNHIRIQDLIKLSEADIDKLIPIIGHQIIFRNSLQSLEEDNLETNEIIVNKECNITNIAQCSSDNQEKHHQLENYREETFNNSDISLPYDVIIDVPPASPSSISESSVLALSTSSATNIVQNLDLECLLQSTLLGRAVIQSYRSSEVLDTKCQSLLVEIIITHLLNSNQQRLLNDDFNDLAEKIIILFPNEVKGVYYIPPLRKRHSSENISGVSKGKLVDKYRNTLTLLRKCGVLKSSRKGEVQNRSSDDSDEGEKISENENGSFVWLKNRTEPWTEVEKHWDRSFNFRNRMFKDKKVTIHDIYNECLFFLKMLAIFL
ncbi:uncharacterized protein LOC123683860 isoform X2 [Harmonia axyridis]|nr:uncharacterized protein LOC123683860 isoform X2 [Harmonia axyridis]